MASIDKIVSQELGTSFYIFWPQTPLNISVYCFLFRDNVYSVLRLLCRVQEENFTILKHAKTVKDDPGW